MKQGHPVLLILQSLPLTGPVHSVPKCNFMWPCTACSVILPQAEYMWLSILPVQCQVSCVQPPQGSQGGNPSFTNRENGRPLKYIHCRKTSHQGISPQQAMRQIFLSLAGSQRFHLWEIDRERLHLDWGHHEHRGKGLISKQKIE